MPNESINHNFTKNPMIPQDATISTHCEENKVDHANVKGSFAPTGYKKNLQHLQILNKYINDSKNTLTQPWYCWSSLGKRTYQVNLILIPRTEIRGKPKDELNPMVSKALFEFWAN